MAMSAVTREAGVLKLVHPGSFVEIHRSPVRAAEVMERNPRHYVTRPDVFKFPWIVVRPESILNPGRVFYVVPCRTLYRLVRKSRPSTPPNRSPATVVPIASREDSTTIGSKSCLKKETFGGSNSRGRRRVAFRLPEDCGKGGMALSTAGGGRG